MYERSALWDCDPIMQFRMKRDLVVEGQPLNSLGFRAREFTSKNDGTFRILALGDSCTFGFGTPSRDQGFFVPVPYPQRLETLSADATRPVEVLNAGVCGYNTYHGILLLRSKLRNLEPDLITVRYGWNDLLASGAGAQDAFRETSGTVSRTIEDLLLRTKFFGFVHRVGMALESPVNPVKGAAARPLPTTWAPSVPVERYEAHLRRLAELARSQGARVWFLTSTHAFMTTEYQGRDAEYAQTAKSQLATIGLGGIPSFAELAAIHARYNETTRAVGAELGIPVVDIEAEYRRHADEHLFSDTDVLHPLQRGHDLEAALLHDRLQSEGAIAETVPHS
jgi:lysophospholipase L1-like esterase